MTVYALLVGIDDYGEAPLRGCVADIERVHEFLDARVPTGGVAELMLRNHQASRVAVIAAIRRHLGQAGAGDVALMWFCGHGGEEPVPDEYWHIEPSGYLQTLVCVDSRTIGPDGVRVPDLVDKELGVLLDEVAARGPHVVVVLDSCHSGGATRDPDVTLRGMGRAPDRLPLSSFLPEWAEARDLGAAVHMHDRPRIRSHVVLAACGPRERAQERQIDGGVRGVFSHALLGGLQTLAPSSTYRDLLSTARCNVQNLTAGQSPMLEPVETGLADQPFLGGRISRPADFRLRFGRSGWEVDAGRCHGVPEPTPDDPLLFAVLSGAGSSPAGLLRVRHVRPASSLVEPVDWTPDRRRTHPVVASVPMPPCAVVVGGLPDDDAAGADLVSAAVRRAGPCGGPSLDVRVVDKDERVDGLTLRVTTGSGVFEILRADGTAATAAVTGHTALSAELVVARLEHIARWTHLLQLENPASALTGAVRVDVVEVRDDERVVPRDRPAMLPDGRGVIRLAYRLEDDRWLPPRVFLRLRNTSRRSLWCVLLDLTDRYEAHASLYPGDFVAPGGMGAALDGRPIEVRLPNDRELTPSACVRDWLKLIVAEEPVSSLAFNLPPLDQHSTRGPVRANGFVDSLALRATTRDLSGMPAKGPGGDWATAVLPLVSEVPAG